MMYPITIADKKAFFAELMRTLAWITGHTRVNGTGIYHLQQIDKDLGRDTPETSSDRSLMFLHEVGILPQVPQKRGWMDFRLGDYNPMLMTPADWMAQQAIKLMRELF